MLFRRWPRIALRLLLTIVVVIGIFGWSSRTALAFFGFGDVTFNTTVEDFPRKTSEAVKKGVDTVKAKVKIGADIAFQNMARQFLAHVTQEFAIQLATTRRGQKPLFMTNPQTFFRDVADAAAGDFIDGFTRGVTGGSFSQTRGATGGQLVGASTGEARQRFVISRILRAAAGNPVQQCQDACRTNYSIVNTQITGLGSFGQLNEHEYNFVIISGDIKKTEGVAAKTPDQAYTCPDIVQPPLTGTYVPFEVALGNTWPGLTAKQCLSKQREAYNTEQFKASSQTKACLTECRNGVPGATLQAINAFTATDIFGAVEKADVRQAPADIANALSRSKSDIGQLLTAAGALTATVQERVLGEDTNLKAGVLPKTSPVSKKVQTPKEATSALFGIPFYNSSGQLTYTGTGVADILKGLASFLNSPVGRALTTYFKSKCGLNPDSCRGPSNPKSALGQLIFGSGGPTGTAGAQLQFASLGRPELITGDPGRNEVAVTDQLVSGGLIDAQFRTAIEEQLTVREALDRKLLDSKKTFGFDKNGVEPRDGYPYRSLQYLRKYRITPVGWELAAKYSQAFDHRDLSLGFLTGAFNLCGQDRLVCSNDETKLCTVDSDCGSGNTCGLAPGQQSHSVCTGGTTPGQSCLRDNDCGRDSDGRLGRCTASPYCGLVDPDWVLKAPQTYCRRQGAGEEIITRQFVCDQNNVDKTTGNPIPPGVTCDANNPNAVCTDTDPPNCTAVTGNTHPDIGRWVVERNADTCADSQSCIAENEDGTCLAYGYCVQERQNFKFSGTQCTAENASCTTYTDANGKEASYLASTLDFRNCSADAAGCQAYCQQPSFDANTNTWTCTAATGAKINFTDQVGSCSSSQAGCRQFTRTVNGSNLLPNSGFETFQGAAIDSGLAATFTGWSTADLITGQPTGIRMVPVTADDPGVTVNNKAAVAVSGSADTDALSQSINTGYSLNERTLTASIRAKATGSCQARLSLSATKTDGMPLLTTSAINVGSSWQSFSATLFLPPADQATFANSLLTFRLQLGTCTSAGLVVDSAQLEEASTPTGYKDYGAINNIYLSAARQQCTSEDVGCELYTPVAGGPAVTAVGRDSNRCSVDNVGCATYHREPITSVPRRDYPSGVDVTIVAPRGKICSAADVGCEEYTNLDEVARGGEAKAYFKAVKQCVKPTNAQVTTATYYTWVGDPQRGFLLRAYDLAKSNIDGAPCTNLTIGTTTDEPRCDDANRVNTDGICNTNTLATNAECAQYYDSQLNVYYRLRQQTISVTNDCHPYRNTIDQADAATTNRVYFLSPRENIACSASAASCRAYTGNAGKTTRQIFRDTFEPGTTANWTGGAASSASVNLNGHSMKIGNLAFTTSALTQNQFSNGKTYLVSFIAAAATNVPPTVTASLGTASGAQFNEISTMTFSGTAVAKWNEAITPPGPEWNSYTLGPLRLDQDLPPDLRLALKTTGDVYVDNVTLTEINDSLYLVSTSVPLCPASEIGCTAYRDRQRQLQYFKSFSRICSEQVVGCEALIDTQNSSTPFAQTVKNVTTPADQVVTYVNNRAAYCAASAKGCEALGQPVTIQDDTLTGYRTVYLKNDPDRYARDLCLTEEVSCQAFTQTDGAAAFFKDPTNRTCEFRADTGQSLTGGAWYITGTSYRCPSVTPPQSGRPVGPSCSPTCGSGDRVGKACVSDTDCPNAGSGLKCLGDPTKIGKITGDAYGQCSTDADCLGGNKCVYLAGICPNDQNGCAEYRDPSDPANCRSECPLELQGATPIYLDSSCQRTRCQNSSDSRINGQNCQSDSQCAGGTCVGSNGAAATGIPGCQPYYYLRQSLEDQAAECNGQINLATGCRPFNDTSNPTLNFRGQ